MLIIARLQRLDYYIIYNSFLNLDIKTLQRENKKQTLWNVPCCQDSLSTVEKCKKNYVSSKGGSLDQYLPILTICKATIFFFFKSLSCIKFFHSHSILFNFLICVIRLHKTVLFSKAQAYMKRVRWFWTMLCMPVCFRVNNAN